MQTKLGRFFLRCLEFICGFGKCFCVIVAIFSLFWPPIWPLLKCVLVAFLYYPFSRLERLFKDELNKSEVPSS
jgi:hypothetical protein